MSENLYNSLAKTSLVAATGFGIFFLIYGVRHRRNLIDKYRYLYKSGRIPLENKDIEIVETLEQCQKAVNILKTQTKAYKIIGFDCEWISVMGKRRPVALLQLASLQGYCALIRLSKLKHIPLCLREILEDKHLIKVGVASFNDAKNLRCDFGVEVRGTFDLRFLAKMAGYQPYGLSKLSLELLEVDLKKHWKVICSNWEANFLTEDQLDYAANDALVAIEIFFKLSRIIEPKTFSLLSSFWFCNLNEIKKKIRCFYDKSDKKAFKVRNHFKSDEEEEDVEEEPPVPEFLQKFHESWNKKKPKKREFITQKPFYSNCLLMAPDGDLLCTVDYKRARWYTRQNLGIVLSEEPYTVQLTFEPSGRAVGEVGRFYQAKKEDQCVVCGLREAFTRKHIVPREYRKHFPTAMKNKTSHDVLLLCPKCHYMSDMSNNTIREKLAKECNAPFKHSEGAIKYVEDPVLRRVRGAGKALLSNNQRIPAVKKAEFEETIKKYFKVEELTKEILFEAELIDARILREGYVEHGVKVVETYMNEKGGIIALEKLWREHFIKTMRPKFLPELWSINHNADRLQIRAEEGRVTEEVLRSAGLTNTVVKNPRPNLGRASERLSQNGSETKPKED